MTGSARKPIDLKEGDIVEVNLESLSVRFKGREFQHREWSKYLREHGLTLFFRRGVGCIARASRPIKHVHLFLPSMTKRK